MICTYRVVAAPLDGEPFIMEMLPARSDADALMDSLLDPSDSILEAVPYKAVTVTLEEFVNGVWTTCVRKLVVR